MSFIFYMYVIIKTDKLSNFISVPTSNKMFYISTRLKNSISDKNGIN